MAIISISGFAGSGKDTVGKIIQLLTCSCSLGQEKLPTKEEIITMCQEKDLYYDWQYSWEIKKWATPVKKVASMLIGIPEEKWEDQIFKSEYFINISTFEVRHISNLSGKKLILNVQESYDKDDWILCRVFLQDIGTDIFRKKYPNVWIIYLIIQYNASTLTAIATDGGTKIYHSKSQWIITDTRFPNELQAVKDRGGVCIRVNRPIYPQYDDDQVVQKLLSYGYIVDNEDFSEIAINEGFTWHEEHDYWTHDEDLPINNKDLHPSEIEWQSWDFDYVIDNSKDIDHLVLEVEKMLKHFNLK